MKLRIESGRGVNPPRPARLNAPIELGVRETRRQTKMRQTQRGLERVSKAWERVPRKVTGLHEVAAGGTGAKRRAISRSVVRQRGTMSRVAE